MTELIKNNKRHPKYHKRICLNCKSKYKPKASNQLYCSMKCWAEKNKEKLREYHRNLYVTVIRVKKGIERPYYRRNLETRTLRLRILKLLGNKCANPFNFPHPDWCNNVRCLQIDHVRGNGAKWRKVFGSRNYSRIYEEIQKGSKDYQVLCANCNWIKRYTNKELRNKFMKEKA